MRLIAVPRSATPALWASLVALSIGLAAPPARGQAPTAEDTATARLLFEDGRRLASQGRWEDAAERFRRSLDLRPTHAVRYNLAAALDRLGRLVEASELARTVVREARPADPVRRLAENLLRSASPRIGRLTIRVEGSARGAEVSVDGRGVPTARLGVAGPVDPGPHVVAVRRGDREESRRVQVGEGEAVEVALPSPALPEAAAAARAQTREPWRREAPSQPAEGGGLLSRWWFWTAVGVVVVGATVTTTAVVLSSGPARVTGNVGVVEVR